MDEGMCRQSRQHRVTASRAGLVWHIPCALVLLASATSSAHEACRYRFASPTLDGLLRTYKVVRMVVVMRATGADARHAATSLSLDARLRGVQVVIMGAPRALPVRQLARDEAKDKDAELVALVEVQPGGPPKVAIADVRDRDGERLAMLSAVAAGSEKCQEESEAISEEGPAGVAGEQGERRISQDAPTPAGPDHTWYGWQIALADAGTLLLRYTPARRFAWVTYVLGPLAMHAANGQAARASMSLGLRLATPLVAVGVGILAVYAGSCPKDGERVTCGGGLVAEPFAAGMVLAALADGAIVAWKLADDSVESADSGRAGRLSGLAFSVLPFRQGAGAVVAGRF